MPRPPRITTPGVPFHVINRRVMRLTIFEKPADYLAFLRIVELGLARPDAPLLLAFCLMPNHWHLVLMPGARTNLSAWMQWLTVTHTHRYHQHHHTAGEGPLYQGRFKSFPVQDDGHLLNVMRYVEANALRARLVRRAENWPWGSLHARRGGSEQKLLSDPPAPLPPTWASTVNDVMSDDQLSAIRASVNRGTPMGANPWLERMVRKLGLSVTTRPRGRPPLHGDHGARRSGKSS